VLHRVDLYVNSRDWRQLKAQWETNEYIPANFKWNGQTVYNVGIRSRGAGSRNQNKLGLRVDFNRYTTGQTFLGLKSVILDNLTQDPSNIRETTAFKFLRQLGIQVSREAHAAVYVNNVYYGLYAIVEEVDTVALSRWFGEDGGYLFEYRWLFYYWFTYLGPDLATYAPMFETRTHETDTTEALYRPIEAMFRTITEVPDDVFIAAVSEYLDLPLFIRQVAIQDFLSELDGLLGAWGLNNVYLYRFQDRNLSQFILWDADNAFHQLDYPIMLFHDINVLMQRAMAVPEYHQLYVDTLEESAALATQVEGDDPRGWLEREVARELDLIRTAALQDRVKPFTNAEFEQAAADMVRFAQARAPFVRCELGPSSRISCPIWK
jgi:spore coat protein CotH